MDDQEYLEQQVMKRHESARPSCMNRDHGKHVKDEDSWRGKEKADPTAGSGDGGPKQPPKSELI